MSGHHSNWMSLLPIAYTYLSKYILKGPSMILYLLLSQVLTFIREEGVFQIKDGYEKKEKSNKNL